MGAPEIELLFREDFTDGLRVGTEGAPWRVRAVDELPQGDGVARAVPGGLAVAPTGTHPQTGEPAFAAPICGPDGSIQHLRWAAFTTYASQPDRAGFAAAEDRVLGVTVDLAVRGFGLLSARHPDGADPGADTRLGAAGLISVDLETGLVCDFFVTDRRVYAVYERLALRPGADFAAFTYAVPVADRTPEQQHRLGVRYDRSAGTVTWQVDGADVMSVDKLGFRALDAEHLRRDNGLPEEPVHPRQFTYGLGLFADRIAGQGFELTVRGLEVTSRPRS